MAGPGVSSWIGQRIDETTSSGAVGWPSRIVSRKPWTAGANARRRIRSRLTMLMPIFTLTRSAGVSRIARAVHGSSRALPANPRLTSSTPPRDAASAGHVVVGLAALEPWLIELPWCSQTRRPRSGADSTGASVRRATSSVVSLWGSQISTSLASGDRPSKRSVATGPGVVTADPLARSMVRTLPPSAVACATRCPFTSTSYTPSGRGGAPGYVRLGRQHVQLDLGGPGAERQPYAGRLRLRHRQLLVRDLLRARSGDRQDTAPHGSTSVLARSRTPRAPPTMNRRSPRVAHRWEAQVRRHTVVNPQPESHRTRARRPASAPRRTRRRPGTRRPGWPARTRCASR